MFEKLTSMFSRTSSGPVTAVSPEEAAVLLREEPETVLLDVREPWEWKHGHVDGSVHIPMALLPLRIGELDPSKPHLVLCHHGGRSYQASTFLSKQGFSRVLNVQGGIHLWSLTVDSGIPRY